MNRFAQAALTDEELAQLTDRFATAAKLIKVDKIEIEHKQTNVFAWEAVLVLRLGDRWLGTVLDWMAVEDARGGNFTKMSKAVMLLAQLLHEGGGVPINGASRFTAVAGELDFDKEPT